jgi:DNA-binding transcriptional regulator YiaG
MTPEQVRAIRKRLGLTQQELADTIAASQVTVARWETGVNEPKGAYLKALQELAKQAKKTTKRRG